MTCKFYVTCYMLHATALCKYKILYTLNILCFEGWKSGTGNRKSTNPVGNCQAVSILKPLLKGIIFLLIAQTIIFSENE